MDNQPELASLLVERKMEPCRCAYSLRNLKVGELAGFLETWLRSHADRCDPQHAVGFVEGWFVSENYLRRG